MKNIIRLTAVCIALLLMCSSFAGCLGGGKKAPEKEVVDHVYKYEEKKLFTVERTAYDSMEEFDGASYIGYTTVDQNGYMFTVEVMNKDYSLESLTAYLGDSASGEEFRIPLNVSNHADLDRGIMGLQRLEDGLLAAIYENKVLDAENDLYENNYYFEIYDLDGTVRDTLDLKKIFGIASEDSYFGLNQLCYIEGELLLTIYSDNPVYTGKLIRMGLDGTIKGTIELIPEGTDGYVSVIGSLGDRKVCISVQIYDENYTQKLVVIDLVTGEQIEHDIGDNYQILYNSFGGASGNLYYASDSGINRVDITTGEETELMNFINSDYIYGSDSFYAVSDDEFFSIGTEYAEEEIVLSLTTFKKVPDDQLVPKYLITVASAGGSYNFREQIIEFNRASEEYRIKYIDYSEYNTAEDYTAGETKLNNDIIAGNIPDVLITDQEFSAAKYANKGLFADLYTYMDKDPELPRSAFLENILKACETNGKLYEIPTNIYLMGFMGYKDTIGEYANLTMREFYEKMQSLPEEVTFFREGDYSRDNMLETFFFLSYVNFVDPATGLCDLNNDDFKAILEYVGTLPEKARWEMEDFDYDTFDEEAYNNMFKDGKAIAEWSSLSSFEDFSNYSYSFGDRELDLIGAPAPDRDGMVFTATNLKFLISAKGNFPDQAWEFIKVFFTEENQRDLGWGFPVTKSALEAEKQEALDRIAEREAQEANGENDQVTSEGVIIGGSGDIMIDAIYPMETRETTREDVERIYGYVTSVNKQLLYDASILDIIKEEASEYFGGKKSIDDVAAQAESRVNIKLGEAM